MAVYAESAPKVGFGKAIKLYFCNYVNFSSRSRRSEYWWVVLFNIIMGTLIGMLVPALSGIYMLATFLPSLSLCVRRLHDAGKSGWWYLLILVPFGFIFLIVWYCTDSKQDNQWGPNPKAVSGSAPVWEAPAKPVPSELPARPAIPEPTAGPTVIEPSPVRVPQQPMPSVMLHLQSGPMAGTSFRNSVGHTVVLGRNPAKCDIVLSQYSIVSGTHCKISFFSDHIVVEDLNSTNGTYVNGTRLMPNRPVSVRNGETIYLAGQNCAIQVRFQ